MSSSSSSVNQVNKSRLHYHSPLQALPLWHSLMCFSTFFIVWQWGSRQVDWEEGRPGFPPWFGTPCSRRWHLCACNSSTSCCCISRRFSGSAVADCSVAATTDCWEPPGNWCCVGTDGRNTCYRCTFHTHHQHNHLPYIKYIWSGHWFKHYICSTVQSCTVYHHHHLFSHMVKLQYTST